MERRAESERIACREANRLNTRRRARLKPLQLRVPAIATGAPTKHLARKQRLTPQRDQALGVEVPRVNRPQAHGGVVRRRAKGDGSSIAFQPIAPGHDLQFPADGFLDGNDGPRLEYERGKH